MATVLTPRTEASQPEYVVGQTKPIHKVFERRSAQNSAAFLIPYIKSTDTVLDVGCGPGTITAGLAALVPQGSCTGLDISSEALKAANENAEKMGVNVKFVLGNGVKLPFDDNTFDIVYSSQLLIHTPNPISIITEIRRVLKPNGFYGSRESDMTTIKILPHVADCDKSFDLLGKSMELNGSNIRAGQVLQDWAAQAGFDPANILKTYSWMVFEDDYKIWTHGENNPITKAIIASGNASEKELERIAESWKRFGELPLAEKDLGLTCGEIVCVK